MNPATWPDMRWNWNWYRNLSRAIYGCLLCGTRFGPCLCGAWVDAVVQRVIYERES